jgi:predicted glutamine amidotransferase
MPKGYGPHDDGSGVAWLKDGTLQIEKRGGFDAWDSSFQDLVESIRTTALIAHNRKASVGLDVNVNVSHPYTIRFRGEEIAFCHNGGIKTFMTEAQDRKITDSLVFLERLIQKVGTLTLEDLKAFLVESSATWEYSSLNALLLTKDSIFAWRCYDDPQDSTWDRGRYCSLYLRESPERVCIASEPVDRKRNWVSIPNRTLIQVRLGGERVETAQTPF